MGEVELVVLAGEGDVEGPGEAVPEVVAGARLEGLPVVHHALHGVGLLGAVELLLVGLAALYHGHGQHVLHEVRVDVQHPHGLFPGLFSVACMVWPSCHRNSRWRRKGRLVFSQRRTEHHWLYSLGRSRWEWMMFL